MQTNFSNTPINPNLAHNVRTNSVGAHRVRPLLFCGIFREAKRLPYKEIMLCTVGDGFSIPFQRQTNYYSLAAQDPSVVVPDTFRCHSRAKCRARSEESWAQLPRG